MKISRSLVYCACIAIETVARSPPLKVLFCCLLAFLLLSSLPCMFFHARIRTHHAHNGGFFYQHQATTNFLNVNVNHWHFLALSKDTTGRKGLTFSYLLVLLFCWSPKVNATQKTRLFKTKSKRITIKMRLWPFFCTMTSVLWPYSPVEVSSNLFCTIFQY